MSTLSTKNDATKAYLRAATAVHGIGSVIMLPDFQEVNGEWVPVVGNGMRGTVKEGMSYLRLGSISFGDGLKQVVKLTNLFIATDELLGTIQSLGIQPGGKIPGKLIAEERLTPFNDKNPMADIKWAVKDIIPCTVAGQPIFRRIIHVYSPYKEDILIQHDNGSDISAHAKSTRAAASFSALSNVERMKAEAATT